METYRELFERNLLQYDAYNELQHAERKYLRGNVNYCAERCADMAKTELTPVEKKCLRHCIFNITENIQPVVEPKKPS